MFQILNRKERRELKDFLDFWSTRSLRSLRLDNLCYRTLDNLPPQGLKLKLPR